MALTLPLSSPSPSSLAALLHSPPSFFRADYTNEGATGKATNDVSIKNVNFKGSKNNVAVTGKGQQVYVL